MCVLHAHNRQCLSLVVVQSFLESFLTSRPLSVLRCIILFQSSHSLDDTTACWEKFELLLIALLSLPVKFSNPHVVSQIHPPPPPPFTRSY